MISKEVYLEMKKYIAEYEAGQIDTPPISKRGEQPYLKVVTINVETIYKYNPNYGNDRVCKCGHSYYRHFDSYENMEAVGCKYCGCDNFKEKKIIVTK